MDKLKQVVLDILSELDITIEDDTLIPGELNNETNHYLSRCIDIVYRYSQEIENELYQEQEDAISSLQYDHDSELKYLHGEINDKQDEIDNLKNEISDLEYTIRDLS